MNFFLLDGEGFIQRFIEWIIQYGGLYVLLLIIFAETGLFVGFFFPGDSLLFAAGIFLDNISNRFIGVNQDTATHFGWPHIAIILMVILASILGNIVGYWFGRKAGPLLYDRRETWLFKKKHLVKAKSFYDKYGKGTIFFAKFLPFIRTFAPIVAGMVKMDKAFFAFYNIIGSICWVATMMLGGYFLDNWIKTRFGISLQDHIELITIGIVVITTLPVLYRVYMARKKETENETPSSNS
jgi:membrane-associated protein